MHSATLVPLPANTTAANNFARPPQPGNSTVGGYPVEYDALLVYGGLGRYAFFSPPGELPFHTGGVPPF